MKRRKMSRKGSGRYFTATGKRVHPKNGLGPSVVMRGGIRL